MARHEIAHGDVFFMDQQRGRSVREVDRKKAHCNALTPDPARDFGGDLLDLAGCGLDRLPGLGDTHR